MASVVAASSAKDRLRACDYPEAGGRGALYNTVFTTSLVEIKYQLVDDSTDYLLATVQKLSSSA